VLVAFIEEEVGVLGRLDERAGRVWAGRTPSEKPA
jgi:hypothetical protein